MRGYGFGIQQPPAGDRRWVPWVNAPPGTEQRLGIFYLLSRRGPSRETLDAVARFTRMIATRNCPGYRTFTSHYHIEHALGIRPGAKATEHWTGNSARTGNAGIRARRSRRAAWTSCTSANFMSARTPRLPAKERLAQLKTLARRMCPACPIRSCSCCPAKSPTCIWAGTG